MMQRPSKVKRKRVSDPNVYPEGWDYERTRRIAEYYDRLKDQPVLGRSRKSKALDFVWMEIPRDLVDQVLDMIETKRKSA
jgi:hypothetical protein